MENTNSTKEGVSGNRVVRESSSVRKIKIDLGVICNQSPERKTTLISSSGNHHQRSGSIRRLSKKTSSASAVGSKSHHYN